MAMDFNEPIYRCFTQTRFKEFMKNLKMSAIKAGFTNSEMQKGFINYYCQFPELYPVDEYGGAYFLPFKGDSIWFSIIFFNTFGRILSITFSVNAFIGIYLPKKPFIFGLISSNIASTPKSTSFFASSGLSSRNSLTYFSTVCDNFPPLTFLFF